MIVRSLLLNKSKEVWIYSKVFTLTIELVLLPFPWSCYCSLNFCVIFADPSDGHLCRVAETPKPWNGIVDYGFYCTMLSLSSNWTSRESESSTYLYQEVSPRTKGGIRKSERWCASQQGWNIWVTTSLSIFIFPLRLATRDLFSLNWFCSCITQSRSIKFLLLHSLKVWCHQTGLFIPIVGTPLISHTGRHNPWQASWPCSSSESTRGPDFSVDSYALRVELEESCAKIT